MNIAVAGTGHVGFSLAVLLAQHNPVAAVDVAPERVERINRRKSTFQDDYSEKYPAEKELSLSAGFMAAFVSHQKANSTFTYSSSAV